MNRELALKCKLKCYLNPCGNSHRGQKIFSLPPVVPCFPLLGLTASGLFMGLSSTLIYTSELILCFTIFVPSAMRQSTRKSVKLLTILVAFSSHFMKRGTCLFILYENMRDM